MGWFWGAKKAEPASPPPSQDAPVLDSPAVQSQPPPSASRSSDAEVDKFLEEIMGEVRNMRDAESSQASTTPPPPASTPNKHFSSWASRWASSSSSGHTASSAGPTQDVFTSTSTSSEQEAGQQRLSPLAESLLPTEMSCEQAFNLAFYCQSLGGQWNNVYRYGEVRSCSEHWNDLFFCMRIKGMGEGKVKEDMIREHYRNKHLAKYGPGKPSSEDIWRERRERVPPGEAFTTPVEPPQLGDAELQKWEMERMEQIRQGLKDS